MSRRVVTGLVAVILLIAAGCGDDGADEATDAAEPETEAPETTVTTAGDGDEPAAGEEPTVTIDDLDFGPSSLEVSAGTTVVWTNEDSVGHTVTAGEPGDATREFDEGLGPGESVEITFDEPGTYPYFCSIHPGMTAEVVVS